MSKNLRNVASYRGVNLCRVYHTAESFSVVCITLLSQIPRFRFRSLHHTAESINAVCTSRTHKSQSTPWQAAHRRVNLLGVQHTAESISVVGSTPPSQSPWCACSTPPSQSPRCASHHMESIYTPWRQNRNIRLFLIAFKGTIRKNPFKGNFHTL